MGFLRAPLIGVGFLLAVHPAVAAERNNCLSPDERRAILETRKAVPLARAMHVVKSKLKGDVLKVRLCRQEPGSGKGLVYVLTVLSRNGKVLQARVDADDGHWLGAT
jgi:uncharacterized membrane protein YkoI